MSDDKKQDKRLVSTIPGMTDIDPTGLMIQRTIEAVEHRYRRYALLYAATLILYSPEFRCPAAQTPYLAAIDYAEQMLAEIERREK